MCVCVCGWMDDRKEIIESESEKEDGRVVKQSAQCYSKRISSANSNGRKRGRRERCGDCRSIAHDDGWHGRQTSSNYLGKGILNKYSKNIRWHMAVCKDTTLFYFLVFGCFLF